MTPAERHFLDTINDLKEKITKGTQYDLIRASGLLRQLLLDNPCLIDKANEKYRKGIFYVTNTPTEKNNKPFIQDGLRYETLITVSFIDPGESTISTAKYKKKQFLSYAVFDFQNHTFTIKDIIRISANVLGGVHFGKATEKEDEILLIANDMIQNADKTSNCAFAIKNIGNVVIKATKDLVEEIKTQK